MSTRDAEVDRLTAEVADLQCTLNRRIEDYDRTRDALLPLLIEREPYSDDLPGDRSKIRAGWIARIATGLIRDQDGLVDRLTRERDEARAALVAWHAECDAVGIPYDPPGLVRHHRGNAGLAAALDAMREGQAQAAHVVDRVDRVRVVAAEHAESQEACGGVFEGIATALDAIGEELRGGPPPVSHIQPADAPTDAVLRLPDEPGVAT